MNELVVKDNIKIEDMIYEIRGKQVMIDSDVARIYRVETKRINETVKRNLNRFPSEFCFRLTKEELEQLSLRSQFATLNNSFNYRGQHYKYLPYAFTEHGVMMLSGLLKSEIAARMNVAIINAFVNMKRFISNNLLEQRYINNKVFELDERVNVLETAFNDKTNSNEIFFEGQIYDAYSFLLDILDSSSESIIVIDNFANKKLFDLLSRTNKEIIVYSKNIDEELINKYNEQYHNVILKNNNSFHDRYIIIDKKVLYHCGASFKDLGTKCFSINRIDNIEMVNDILKRIE